MESTNIANPMVYPKRADRQVPLENSSPEEIKACESENFLESAPMIDDTLAEGGIVTHSNNEAPEERTNVVPAKKGRPRKERIFKNPMDSKQTILEEYFSSKKVRRDSDRSVPNLIGLTSAPQGAAGTRMEIQQEHGQVEPEQVKDSEQSIPETDERFPASHEERKEAEREGSRTSTDLLGNLSLSEENVFRQQRASEGGRISDAQNEVNNIIKRTKTLIRERTKRDGSKGQKKRK